MSLGGLGVSPEQVSGEKIPKIAEIAKKTTQKHFFFAIFASSAVFATPSFQSYRVESKRSGGTPKPRK
jgi:hypothetical protein